MKPIKYTLVLLFLFGLKAYSQLNIPAHFATGCNLFIKFLLDFQQKKNGNTQLEEGILKMINTFTIQTNQTNMLFTKTIQPTISLSVSVV